MAKKKQSPETCEHKNRREIKMGRWFGSEKQTLYKIVCCDCGTGDGFVVKYEYRDRNEVL